jgi:hypothetical protein
MKRIISCRPSYATTQFRPIARNHLLVPFQSAAALHDHALNRPSNDAVVSAIPEIGSRSTRLSNQTKGTVHKHGQNDRSLASREQQRPRPSNRTQRVRSLEKERLRDEAAYDMLDDSEGKSSLVGEPSVELTTEETPRKERTADLTKIHRHVRLELRWLPTNVSIAQRVARFLDEGNEAMALEMTRMSSKKKDSATVCWNHLIKHSLNQPLPRVNHAFKLYNEVREV